MVKLYAINELTTDVQQKVYEEYIRESNVTMEETPIEAFIDYSVTYLGKMYTEDGTFIEDISMEYKCLNCGLDPVKVPYYMDATCCPKCGCKIDYEYVNLVKENIQRR